VDVHAIAHDFRRDFVMLEHGTDKPRCPMADRRHPVEEMRRLTRPSGDACQRLVIRRP
jgi:hypothetical protein